MKAHVIAFASVLMGTMPAVPHSVYARAAV